MKKPQLKKSYLACAIPALLLAGLEGCGNGLGGTTASNVHNTSIVFSTAGLTNGESIAAGGAFTVAASIINPAVCFYSSSNISEFSLQPASESITVESCTIQPTLIDGGSGVATEPCQLNVSVSSNATHGTYTLIMKNLSYNFPNGTTVYNIWWNVSGCTYYQLTDVTSKVGPFFLPESGEVIQFTVATPVSESKYIFLTESLYNGALGGVAGANAACKSDNNNPLGAESGTWKAALYNNNPVFTVGESYTLWADYPYSYANGTYNPTESTFSAESAWIAPLVIGTFRDTWFQSAGIQAHCHGGSAGIGWTTNGGAHQGEFIRIQPTHLSEPVVPPATATCSQEKRLICIQQ